MTLMACSCSRAHECGVNYGVGKPPTALTPQTDLSSLAHCSLGFRNAGCIRNGGMSTQQCPMAVLKSDKLKIIFLELGRGDVRALARCETVCKAWKLQAGTIDLWALVYQREFQSPPRISDFSARSDFESNEPNFPCRHLVTSESANVPFRKRLAKAATATTVSQAEWHEQ